MSNIIEKNTTTQLLIQSVGVSDQYESFKLSSDQILMDDKFFDKNFETGDRPANVKDVMPRIFTIGCPNMNSQNSICTWEIADDLTNGIAITETSAVLNIKDASGNTVLAANSLVEYDSTYALQIYIKSNNNINENTYFALVQL